MRKTVLTAIILLLLCGSTQLRAQALIKHFLEAPERIFPLLGTEMRQQMIEKYQQPEQNADAGVMNLLKSKSKILSMQPLKLELSLDDSTAVDMVLLPMVNKSHLIAVLRHSRRSPEQSSIHFYTLDWELLPTAEFLGVFTPSVLIRQAAEDEIKAKVFLEQLGTITYKMQLSIDDKQAKLRLIPTGLEQLPERFRATASAYLYTEGVDLLWDKYRFISTK